MGVMRVLGERGDTELRWTKRAFDNALGKGMIAFKVDPDTGRGSELIREFDPDAHEIILSRQLKGG